MALAIAMFAALLVSAPAWAAAPVLRTSFGSDTIVTPGRIAADDATGDVYIIDSGSDVVDHFAVDGTLIDQLRGSVVGDGTFNFSGDDDVAVDNSGGVNQGNVYVVSESASLAGRPSVFAFDANGAFLWEAQPTGFSDTCGVAVNSSGQLYASDFSGGVQQLSTTDGSVVGSPIVVTGNTCHIAFDSADNLLLNHWVNTVDKYAAPAYTSSTQIDAVASVDVATDTSNDDIYALPGNEVHVFDSSGNAISGTPFDTGTILRGVSVAGGQGTIFVSDNTSVNSVATARVQVFDRVGGAAPKPTARTGDATSVALTSATLNGATNPNGASTTCTIEYGTTTALGSSQACSAGAGSGTSEAPVSADVTGLAAHTTYFYRLVTTSTNGTTRGAIQTFTTDVPPTPVAGAATAVTQSGATLNGTVNPNGLDVTDCHFEYGKTTAYGSSAPCAALPGNGSSAVDVSAAVTGLDPNTTYHYKLLASTSAGTAESSDATFATLPNAPAVTTGDATGVSQTGATLGGTVNAQGVATTCTIEYGTSASYGSSVPCSPTPSGSSAVAVSATLSGLAPGTTYHYRVTARNAGGTTNGADKTFTTTTPPSSAVLSYVGANTLTVKGGRVAIKVECSGDSGASCQGTLQLTAKAKKGKKVKTVTIGKVSVSLTATSTKTLTIKLNATGKRLLAKSKRHKIGATLSGLGIDKQLTLKAKVVKKPKHRRHHK